jgi:hypothetical protein
MTNIGDTHHEKKTETNRTTIPIPVWGLAGRSHYAVAQ